MTLESLPDGFRATIWGASGGIGRALVEAIVQSGRAGDVVALSRTPVPIEGARSVTYDPNDEGSIASAAESAASQQNLHLVIVATGTLHGNGYAPEKALRQLSGSAFLDVMRINALLPAMIAKASVGHLDQQRSVFAALSARVGSISDNRLGGWHSYRASKAALNMLLRNIAIETARKNKGAVIAGLHPGTVDTQLSEPFQGNVPDGKLFKPGYSAGALLDVIDGLQPEQSGMVFDYAGSVIPF